MLEANCGSVARPFVDRRRLLKTGGALALSAAFPPHGAADAAAPGLKPGFEAVLAAYRYGLPIYDNARITYLIAQSPLNPLRVAPNVFLHSRRLADHRSRIVTTPNNDTLYSAAYVDLSTGPVTLTVPDFGERYYSVALIDAYTNNADTIGTRVSGGRGDRYVILPPGYTRATPSGRRGLRATTPHIIVLARILVEGPDDLDDVHELQNGLKLSQAAGAPTPTLIAPNANDPETFVALVNQVLRANPPPPADRAILTVLATVGVGPDAGSLSNDQKALWRTHFAAAQTALFQEVGTFGAVHEGWTYLPRDVGHFGTDYATRAAVAITSLWINDPEEAVYTFATADAKGGGLTGSHSYRLRIPAGAPPANSFWSLSIYEVEPDQRLFFFDNPLHRYAIGDRTKGLKKNPDGSLDVYVQRAAPAADLEANWLPAPDGAFRLVARAYLPRADLLEGRFKYPGLERVA